MWQEVLPIVEPNDYYDGLKSCISIIFTFHYIDYGFLIFYLTTALLMAGIQTILNHNLIGIVFFVAIILLLLPLLWMIPLTKKCQRKLKNNEEMSFKFKIIVLIFVNIIAGILLFFRKEDEHVLS